MRDRATFNAVAKASNWSDIMAKNNKFYPRGPVPKKVKPVPIEQRGKLVEFPKEKFTAQSKTENTTERGEVSPSIVLFFGLFFWWNIAIESLRHVSLFVSIGR